MYLPKKQSGMTAIGVATIIALVTIVALFALKLMPIYLESWKVDTLLESLKNEQGLGKQPQTQIWRVIKKRMAIDTITDISRENFVFQRSGDKTLVTVDWEVQTNLMGNVDLLVYFSKEGELH